MSPSLLLTRPEGANQRFVAQLPADLVAQVQLVFSPLIDIQPVPVEQHEAVQAAIFTSVNGVIYAPEGAGKMAFCVGKRTAELAQTRGWQVTFSAPDAQTLKSYMISERPEAHFTHFSGVHTHGDICATLTEAGISSENVVVYDQIRRPLSASAISALLDQSPVIVPLFSQRTARQFADEILAQSLSLEHSQIIALSPAVAEPIASVSPNKVALAETPDAQAMQNITAKHIQIALQRRGSPQTG